MSIIFKDQGAVSRAPKMRENWKGWEKLEKKSLRESKVPQGPILTAPFPNSVKAGFWLGRNNHLNYSIKSVASGLTVTVNSNTIICLHKSKSICCICLALFTVSGLLQKAVKLQPLKKVGLRKITWKWKFPFTRCFVIIQVKWASWTREKYSNSYHL